MISGGGLSREGASPNPVTLLSMNGATQHSIYRANENRVLLNYLLSIVNGSRNDYSVIAADHDDFIGLHNYLNRLFLCPMYGRTHMRRERQ